MYENSGGLVRAEILFDGEVQGVGFRYYARRAARRLRLLGFVENLEDGRVRIVCEGAREKIEELIESMKRAPPPIHVDEVVADYTDPKGEFRGFNIVTGDIIHEILEGFSTGATYFEAMFQKQDEMLKKQDEMLERQDKMLGKQDELIGEFRDLRRDMRTLLDERISKIERDIAEIRMRLGLTP